MQRRRALAGSLALALYFSGAPAPPWHVSVSKAQDAGVAVDLYAWGLNRGGVAGGAPHNACIPTSLHVPGPWVAVAAGESHNLALDAEGQVWAWGSNGYGQLGLSGVPRSALPRMVDGLVGIDRISAGGLHSLAYRASDRKLFAWGGNQNGQLGQPPGTTPQNPNPMDVGLGVELLDIAAGTVHSLAVDVDGNTYAWGGNNYGQLGTGDTARRTTPTLLTGLPRARAVAAGNAHSLAAALDDGQVYSWGLNNFGQLGNGTQGAPDGAYPNPAPVSGVDGVVELSAGGIHSLALVDDGTVWAWGYNTEGQIGNGESTPANTGVLSPSKLVLAEIVHVDAGTLHSVALGRGGLVYAWGGNQFGSVGNNDRRGAKLPVLIETLKGAVDVEAGGRQTLAVAAPEPISTLRMAGNDAPGSGNAPSTTGLWSMDPPVEGLIDVSVGDSHALGLDEQRRVWAWGSNDHGELGVPDGARDAPVLVPLPRGGAVGFVQVLASEGFSLALRSDGALYVWGDNRRGQVGVSGPAEVTVPTRLGLPAITYVAAGQEHVLALGDNGLVWAWGGNGRAQLGARADEAVHAPATISLLFGIQQVWAGAFHSLAMGGNAKLLSWGDNSAGQLGRGVAQSSFESPSFVDLEPFAVVASGGRFHTVMITAGGEVYGVGSDRDCQSGAGGPTRLRPGPVVGMDLARGIDAGAHHSAAVGVDGTAWVWGNDSRGQLGIGREGAAQCRPRVAGSDAIHVDAGRWATAVLASSP